MTIIFMFVLTGLASAPIRGCSGDEDVRAGKDKCQPTHLPVKQEILRQIVSK